MARPRLAVSAAQAARGAGLALFRAVMGWQGSYELGDCASAGPRHAAANSAPRTSCALILVQPRLPIIPRARSTGFETGPRCRCSWRSGGKRASTPSQELHRHGHHGPRAAPQVLVERRGPLSHVLLLNFIVLIWVHCCFVHGQSGVGHPPSYPPGPHCHVGAPTPPGQLVLPLPQS